MVEERSIQTGGSEMGGKGEGRGENSQFGLSIDTSQRVRIVANPVVVGGGWYQLAKGGSDP